MNRRLPVFFALALWLGMAGCSKPSFSLNGHQVYYVDGATADDARKLVTQLSSESDAAAIKTARVSRQGGNVELDLVVSKDQVEASAGALAMVARRAAQPALGADGLMLELTDDSFAHLKEIPIVSSQHVDINGDGNGQVWYKAQVNGDDVKSLVAQLQPGKRAGNTLKEAGITQPLIELSPTARGQMYMHTLKVVAPPDSKTREDFKGYMDTLADLLRLDAFSGETVEVMYTSPGFVDVYGVSHSRVR